jgi:hypothetical protein
MASVLEVFRKMKQVYSITTSKNYFQGQVTTFYGPERFVRSNMREDPCSEINARNRIDIVVVSDNYARKPTAHNIRKIECKGFRLAYSDDLTPTTEQGVEYFSVSLSRHTFVFSKRLERIIEELKKIKP